MRYCPTCTQAMQRQRAHDFEFAFCKSCAGVFIAWVDLQALCIGAPELQQARCADLTTFLDGFDSSDRNGPVHNGSVCPVCRNELSAQRLGKRVEPFYYCQAHGAMFDTASLRRLLGALGQSSALATHEKNVKSESSGDWFEGGAIILEVFFDAITGWWD